MGLRIGRFGSTRPRGLSAGPGGNTSPQMVKVKGSKSHGFKNTTCTDAFRLAVPSSERTGECK